MREFCMLNPETYLDLKEYRILGSGFGKDLRHGNYKIVRLLKPMKAEVFTLGTTNSWREIGICGNDNQYDDLEEHVYLKGKCFWLMSFSDPWAVLCFDLCTEIFHTIPLPSLTGMEICGTLSVRDDSLCFFWYPPETASGNCIHMWELDFNDDGVGIEDFTYSWRKCLETEPFERFYVPLTFWQSDELLLKRESYSPEGDRILSYNIPTRRLRKVKLPVYGKLGSIYYRGPYVKSLVSIKENKLA